MSLRRLAGPPDRESMFVNFVTFLIGPIAIAFNQPVASEHLPVEANHAFLPSEKIETQVMPSIKQPAAHGETRLTPAQEFQTAPP